MFPDNGGPQTGNGFATSAVNQQNNSLLGNPQIQSTAMPMFAPNNGANTTAPLSSSNPNVSNMVQALKGAN